MKNFSNKSTIPRNMRHINTVNKIKKEPIKKIHELESIKKKYNISPLTFRDCKYADINGKMTNIAFEKVDSNMKYAIHIIKISAVEDSEELYDLFTIEKEKIDIDK